LIFTSFVSPFGETTEEATRTRKSKFSEQSQFPKHKPIHSPDPALFDFHLFRFSFWRNHGKGFKKKKIKIW
jgi:hypothetical protein